jgi:hypothetical protein
MTFVKDVLSKTALNWQAMTELQCFDSRLNDVAEETIESSLNYILFGPFFDLNLALRIPSKILFAVNSQENLEIT